MERREEDPQQNPEPTRAQRLDRMFNRMLIGLFIGIVGLGVYQYVLVPMLG